MSVVRRVSTLCSGVASGLLALARLCCQCRATLWDPVFSLFVFALFLVFTTLDNCIIVFFKFSVGQ